MSFNAHVGWNQEVSEVTVQLVQDPCPSVAGKRYYDNNLEPQLWYDADPGLFIFDSDGCVDSGECAPQVGTPVFFRIGEFEFSGLLQSWTQSDGTDGHPVYTVKIVDPRQVLEGTQLIIDKYSGSIYGTFNLLNVYGYQEAIADNCFTSPSGGFGGAAVNDNGIPWNKIKQSIGALTSVIPFNTGLYAQYSNGRLVYRGSICSYGMGALPVDDISGYALYMVDIAEVPFAPSYYRMSGANISLMEAISNICADAGCDYYVELLPTLIDGTIYNIIKLRTVSRVAQPSLTAINTLLSDSDNVINSNHGVELRNETMLNFVIGGPKQGISETINEPSESGSLGSDYIAPYWGVYQSTVVPGSTAGEALPTDKLSSGELRFEADLTSLNSQLIVPLGIDYCYIYEGEIRCAGAGMDEWISWASTLDLPLWTAFAAANGGPNGVRGVHDLTFIQQALIAMDNNNKLRGADLKLGNAAFARQAQSDKEKDLQTLYDFVRTFATEFYGHKYLVRIPNVCHRVDSESNKHYTSEEPSDGGWVDDGSTVLDLPVQSALSDFFALEDGRIGCFVKYLDVEGRNLDFSQVSLDDAGIYDGHAYVKAQLDPNIVYYAGSPRVVVTIGQPIAQKFTGDNAPNIGGLAFGGAAQELGVPAAPTRIENIRKGIGGVLTQWAQMYTAQIPDAAAIPLKSNILTYGPWPGVPTAYQPGKVNVVYDEGLVPWEYNGSTTMNLAGNERVNESVTAMYAGEMGSITIPGYPTKPLGAELNNTTNTFLYENRTATDSGFGYVLTLGTWDGSFGPSISNINTEVSPGGIQTTYQMRTFTPQFGRFTKANVERLRSFAKFRAQQEKFFRKTAFLNFTLDNRRSVVDKRGKKNSVIDPQVNTPHLLLVGQLLNWKDGEYRRTAVETNSVFDAGFEFSQDYATKAAMSFDGLVRPVSLSGDGGFPRFINNVTGCYLTNSAGSQPPMRKGQGGPDMYKLDISRKYLNPLTNPGDAKHGDSTGHDFEIVAHGTGAHTGSITLPMQGYDDEEKMMYADDYRFMAMRGPQVMAGWGYDTNGKPVPNSADTESATSGGTFETENLTDEFLEDWLRKPHTWPVAPVDLRLDRKRGVWVSPPAYRMVTGKLLAALPASGTAEAYMITGPELYDSDGGVVGYSTPSTAPHFTLTDKIGRSLNSGDKFIAYYDADACEYYAIEGPPGSGNSLIRFKLTQNKALDADANGVKINYQGDTILEPIKLIDSIGQWGVARSGWSGWAVQMEDRPAATGAPEYEIIFLEAPYRFRYFTLNTTFTSSQANATFQGSFGSAPNGREIATTGLVFDVQDIFTRARSGASGFAVYNEQNDRYEAIRCQTVAEMIQFRISGASYAQPLSATDTATAAVVSYGGSWLRSQDPGASITVTDSSRTFRRALAGATGIAIYDDVHNVYSMVECQTKAEMITFYTVGSGQFNVAGGGPVSCKLIDYARGQAPAAAGDNISVIDPTRLFKRTMDGATGIAIYDSITDTYAVVECDKKAEGIAFAASQKTINTPFTVTPTQYWRGQNPGTTNVIDIVGFLAGCPSGTAIATYDDINDRYVVTSADHKLAVTATNASTSGTQTELDARHLTFDSCFKADFSSCDITVHPKNNNDITYISGITWDSANCRFNIVTKTIHGVMSCGVLDGPTTGNLDISTTKNVVVSGKCESGAVTLYTTGVKVLNCT